MFNLWVFFSSHMILISVLEVGVYTDNLCSMFMPCNTYLTVKHRLHMWFNRYITIYMWEVNYWKIKVMSSVKQFEC